MQGEDLKVLIILIKLSSKHDLYLYIKQINLKICK